MSDVRELPRSRSSANASDIAPATEDAKAPNATFGRAQPLTDPMAYVRHDRETAAAQIQRSLKAWRKADSDSGAAAGQHEVSQPREPAEQEADAVADHVAGELHGDSKKAGDGEKPAAKHAAPAIGAKLKPGTVSLAKNKNNDKGKKKDEKKAEDPQKERKGNPGGVQSAPDSLPGFPGAEPARPKTSVQGGGVRRTRWKLPDGSILEWDSRHGTVEKYNKRGVHQGEFDPNAGAKLKEADPTRRVEP